MVGTEEKSIYLQVFLKQIDSINNMFDLMALCINYILKVINGQEFDAIQVLNSPNRKYLKIIDSLNGYKQDREINVEYKCLKRLKNRLSNILSMEDEIISQCVRIIMWVDDNCEPEYENDNNNTYDALNTQFHDKIRIIPRMNNRIDNFSSMFSDEKGQEAFRKNYPVRKAFYDNIVCRYIILDEKFLENYKVKIHHLGYGNTFVQKIKDKPKLSFAIFPVLNADFSKYFQVNKIEAEKKAYFDICGMYQGKEKMLKQRYDKILSRCDSEDIDFLIFPEMLMTESIRNSMQKYKTENWLAFWGSIWKDRTNQCIVTGAGGQALLSYDKKIGFDLKEDGKVYSEHLIEKMTHVPYDVLDIEGLGRVGVCICRDLTFQEVYNLHACLETNILIVPTFSASMDIYTGAEELAKKRKCIVVVANSCSAGYDEKFEKNTTTELGFLVAPAKEGSSRSVYKKVYGNVQCMNECKSFCKGILFTVDFSKEMEENNLLTMEITKNAVIS